MLKKLLPILLMFAVHFSTQAQVLTEDFEGSIFPPTNWWSYHTLGSVASAPKWTSSSSAQSGSKSAFLSWQPTPSGMKYDYLVSPQFTPTIANHIISFYQTTGFFGNDGTLMEVRVSTDPIQTNVITNYAIIASYYDYQMPYLTQGWLNTTLDLSQFVGQPIYLSFVVSQFNNGDNWYIDNITSNTVSTSCTINSTVNQNICPGQSFSFNGNNLTTAGTYLDTLLSVYGCDSIISLNLTTGPMTSTLNQSICQGSSYVFNGANRTTAGTYLDTLVAVGGCDSFITLNLTVTPPTSSNFSQTICQGSSYFFNGANRTTAGAYTDTLSTASGCDSLVTLYLTVTAPPSSSFSQTICQGTSYFFNGANRTTAGAYTDTLTTASGCDSLVTLNLSINPAPTITMNAVPTSVCPGDSLKIVASVPGVNNDLTFAAGNYIDCGPMPSLNNASAFTVEAMIRYTSSNSRRIFLKNNSNSTDGISCDQHGGFQNLSFNIGAGASKATGTTANFVCSANAWHHVAYVFDGTATGNSNRMKIYIDGVQYPLTFVNTVPATTPSYNTNAIIGRSIWEGFAYIGSMNDVRVWNVARTQAEIQAGMNTCLTGSTTGLLAEYKLNEAAGASVAVNSTGSANQGTLVNFNTNTCWNISTAGCNAVNYNIPITGGITSNVKFVPSATTTYTATLTGGNGCIGTATATAIVNPIPTIVASSNLMLACAGSVNNLHASGAVSYLWNGTTPGADTTLSPATAGTYTVLGTDAMGCTATTSITILPDNGNTSLPSVNNTTVSMTLTQTDNSTIRYTDDACRSIVTIQDAPGGNTLGSVTASVNLEQYVGSFNGQNYVRRTYEITPTNQGPAMVTLYFTQTDFDYFNVYTPAPHMPTGPSDAAGIANIRITKVSGGALGVGTSSVIIPTSVIWNNLSNVWELTFPVTGFSSFYVHTPNLNNGPLPIQLVSFTGREERGQHHIQWITSSELQNKHFLVQRSSDAQHFETIATVNSLAPQGTSSEMLTYTYTDSNPKTGISYYRLEQVDVDGKSTWSKTISLGKHHAEAVAVYPNPMLDKLFVECFTDKSQVMILQLSDVSGKIIKQTEYKTSAGLNQFTLDTQDIAQGFYNLILWNNTKQVHQQKVIKH